MTWQYDLRMSDSSTITLKDMKEGPQDLLELFSKAQFYRDKKSAFRPDQIVGITWKEEE